MNLFTYNDVCILPDYSDIESRKDVDTSQTIGNIKVPFPIISAPMDTITGAKMASAVSNFGGIGMLHRFWSVQENLNAYNEAIAFTDNPELVGCSFGLKDRLRVETMYKAGCRIFALDIAYSYTKQAGQELQYMKNTYSDIVLISGSVVGKHATSFVLDMGASLARVGIAAGGTCITAMKTGVTMPQLSAVISSVDVSNPVIADGGVKSAGDMCKALGAGAKLVMLGSMLGATDESPGELYQLGEWKFKKVRGMASKEVNDEVLGGMKDWKTAEGVSVNVDYKGSVHDILKDLNGGLRSSMTYVGARTLDEYKEYVEFGFVTQAAAAQFNSHIK